ncbi:hypothetical protein SynWH8101_1211 [Synechococcus sp. WH 8101]|uniref:hypothetical protein n=1 Tax=Synechococcus sp. WH 8101 TaxID=59932 RepID=UPI001023BACD|nr:hypothetical protein [Synechococcus sp. WH 8101]QBE68797.1 hypothetical protein SynWH8101_1211 [Synechococcus sp. WH 8101]QNI45021.1 hypothetical protein SynRCC2555_01238 [Synechococcus sp. WH 8101]
MAFKTLTANPKKEQSGMAFQSSVTLDAADETNSKGTVVEQSTFLAPTAWGAAVGSGASIATLIVDDALVLLKKTKYGKYYDGAKLAIESAAGLVLNEGLEVSKDHERGGWGDGYLDFAEDVALTIGGNYVGAAVATAVLGAAAPALASAAIGVGIASLAGGFYSWVKDKVSNWTSEDYPETLFPPSSFDEVIVPFESINSTNGIIRRFHSNEIRFSLGMDLPGNQVPTVQAAEALSHHQPNLKSRSQRVAATREVILNKTSTKRQVSNPDKANPERSQYGSPLKIVHTQALSRATTMAIRRKDQDGSALRAPVSAKIQIPERPKPVDGKEKSTKTETQPATGELPMKTAAQKALLYSRIKTLTTMERLTVTTIIQRMRPRVWKILNKQVGAAHPLDNMKTCGVFKSISTMALTENQLRVTQVSTMN